MSLLHEHQQYVLWINMQNYPLIIINYAPNMPNKLLAIPEDRIGPL